METMSFSARSGWWGHLAAGHAVNGIVDEDGRDVFATIGHMDYFGGADAG